MYLEFLCNYIVILMGTVKTIFLNFMLPVFVVGQGGCPMYGCTPSGTFSFELKYPTSNVTYAWTHTYISGRLPYPLGCVGNANNIICPTNTSEHKGYVSINNDDGTPQWYDTQLRYPTLPIMDIYGGIIGSDGHNLVRYEANGNQDKPNIKLGDDLFPIYSLSYSQNGIIVIVSKAGYLVTYESNGVPHASMYFHDKTAGLNSTFIPVASPALSGSRVYILTQLMHDKNIVWKSKPDLHRLYAVDIRQTINDRLQIAWHYDFDSPGKDFDQNPIGLSEEPILKPQILINKQQNTLFVIFPRSDKSAANFWSLEDKQTGLEPNINFKVSLFASDLAMFETRASAGTMQKFESDSGRENSRQGNIKENNVKREVSVPLWALSSSRDLILKISEKNGTVLSHINVSTLLDTRTVVTSNLMVIKPEKASQCTLIFGVKVSQNRSVKSDKLFSLCRDFNIKNVGSHFLISISEQKLNWMIASPKDFEIKGQIVGISSSSKSGKNLLVAFGNNANQSSIFAVH